jgi:hypothetical protein
MTYLVQIPLAGIAGWRYLERTEATQKAIFENDAIMQREIAYFEENIGKVETAADLVGDRRMLRFALTAYGLEDDADKKALVRKILEEGTENKEALANRITISGYKDMAADFGFGNEAGAQTATEGFAAKVVARFKERSFENAVSDQNENLGLAMGLARKAEMLSEGEGKTWYTVLGDKQLRKLFEGAFGLPSSFVNIDIDQQARVMEKKAKQMFGDGSLTAFQDPANVDKLILRFLARKQIEDGAASATGPKANALLLLQNQNSNPSQGLLNLFYSLE